MKRIIIVGLIILLSVSNVSAVIDHVNWDCDQISANQTDNGMEWDIYIPITNMYKWCAEYGLSVEEELLYFFCDDVLTNTQKTMTYTSDIINTGGDIDNISVWYRGSVEGTTGLSAYTSSSCYIKILNNTDSVISSTQIMYIARSGSPNFQYSIVYPGYSCTNTSTYDGKTYYCYDIPITESNVKIQYSVNYRATHPDPTEIVYVQYFHDFIRFNELCDTDAPVLPQANSTFYLYDDCGNLLQNPTTTIFRNLTDQIYQGSGNPISINELGNYNRHDKLSVIIDTHDMAVEKTVYADDEFNIYHLTHQNVDWELQTFVYDNFTSDAIESAKVSINQTCRIDDYPTYTYGLTNEYGFVTSYQLSNQNFAVEVTKDGYKDYYGEFTADFDAWDSTYFIEIYLDNTTSEEGYDGNETLPDTPCSTAWSNNDNLIISEINDTEDARLHYMAGSSSTLLYLERWSESTQIWMIEGSSVTLDPFETGYIQYTPVNWTEDETTIYRGRLWSLNCYCDDTSTLKVWNSTDGNETTYSNLTTSIRFLSKIGGHYVNPNAMIQIKAYAASNNTSLLTIDLELYNESTKVDDLSLTFFDWYVDSEFKVYEWMPNYGYEEGFNYTVKMIGFNGALLAIDHVYTNATDESPYNTNNELTVFVLDNHRHQINYATVFIEDWGSIATTGSYNHATVTGLPDGDYQYKATKSGYISSGWATITLTEHESVTCVLVEIESTSVIGQKMSDADIKSIFIPLMYILLIFMLLGAFMYANR